MNYRYPNLYAQQNEQYVSVHESIHALQAYNMLSIAY